MNGMSNEFLRSAFVCERHDSRTILHDEAPQASRIELGFGEAAIVTRGVLREICESHFPARELNVLFWSDLAWREADFV